MRWRECERGRSESVRVGVGGMSIRGSGWGGNKGEDARETVI